MVDKYQPLQQGEAVVRDVQERVLLPLEPRLVLLARLRALCLT